MFVHARLNVVITFGFSFPIHIIYITCIVYIYIYIYTHRHTSTHQPFEKKHHTKTHTETLSGGSWRANDFGLTLGTWFQHHGKSEWSNSMYFGTWASAHVDLETGDFLVFVNLLGEAWEGYWGVGKRGFLLVSNQEIWKEIVDRKISIFFGDDLRLLAPFKWELLKLHLVPMKYNGWVRPSTQVFQTTGASTRFRLVWLIWPQFFTWKPQRCGRYDTGM